MSIKTTVLNKSGKKVVIPATPFLVKWRYENEDIISIALTDKATGSHVYYVLTKTKYHDPGTIIHFVDNDFRDDVAVIYDGEVTIKNESYK